MGDLLTAFSYLTGLERRSSQTPPCSAQQKEERKLGLAVAREILA